MIKQQKDLSNLKYRHFFESYLLINVIFFIFIKIFFIFKNKFFILNLIIKYLY